MQRVLVAMAAETGKRYETGRQADATYRQALFGPYLTFSGNVFTYMERWFIEYPASLEVVVAPASDSLGSKGHKYQSHCILANRPASREVRNERRDPWPRMSETLGMPNAKRARFSHPCAKH